MELVKVSCDIKDSAYIATVLLFNQVGQMCHESNLLGWELKSSYTSVVDEHFITEYTNGKMWVKAVSVNGKHTYSIGEE